jgi:ABC-type transport system involved in multi-copper enzyme maturation permease subunit
MSAFLRATALIARVHFVRSVKSKRGLMCLIFALLPVACAALIAGAAHRASPAMLATNFGWLMLLQIVVPLVALIAGSAVVAEEIEDRTITYLFTRPIPRAALLFGRWIATVVLVEALLMVATFLLLLACERAHARVGPIDEGIRAPLYSAVLLGALVYTGLFAALGAFFKHPMLVGIGYAFAVEGFLANLPGKNQSLTIQFYLRSLIADGGSNAWHRLEGFTAIAFQSGQRAFVTLVIVLVVALALGAWRISTREFELTS